MLKQILWGRLSIRSRRLSTKTHFCLICRYLSPACPTFTLF